MTSLFLTERALRDLIDIERYSLANWGAPVAAAYLDKFQTAFDLISASPRVLRALDGHPEGLRFYRVERHWVVCVPLDDAVYVLAVCHGAMDLPARLGELEPQLMHEVELLRDRVRAERGRADR